MAQGLMFAVSGIRKPSEFDTSFTENSALLLIAPAAASLA